MQEKEIIEVNQREGAIVKHDCMVATRGLATCFFVVLHNPDTGTTMGFHYDANTQFELPNPQDIGKWDLSQSKVTSLLGSPLEAYICTPEGQSVPKAIMQFLGEIPLQGTAQSMNPMNEVVCFDPETKEFSFKDKTVQVNKGPDDYSRLYNFQTSRRDISKDNDSTISIEYDHRKDKRDGWQCKFGLEKEEECKQAVQNFRKEFREVYEKYGDPYLCFQVKIAPVDLTLKPKHLGKNKEIDIQLN